MTTEQTPPSPNDPNQSWGEDLPEIETTTFLAQLLARGGVVSAPESLADNSFPAALNQLIAALAEARIYLANTNHLNDRELYAKLYHEALQHPVLPSTDPTHYDVIDLVGSSSEADMQLYHRYYADEEEREEWKLSYPDYAMPPRERTPFNRDAGLPKSPEMDHEN